MAKLTPSGLETITYGQANWDKIMTANDQRINYILQRVERLLDIDVSGRQDGQVLIYRAVDQKFHCGEFNV